MERGTDNRVVLSEAFSTGLLLQAHDDIMSQVWERSDADEDITDEDRRILVRHILGEHLAVALAMEAQLSEGLDVSEEEAGVLCPPFRAKRHQDGRLLVFRK